MAEHYTFHPEHNLVFTTFTGAVTRETFVSLYRDLYADPAYVLGMDELVDLSAVTKFQVSRSALDEVRTIVGARYSGVTDMTIRTAILAPTDHAFGIGRMYEAISSDTEEDVHVFRSRKEALDWLRPEAPPELLSLLFPPPGAGNEST